MGGKFWRHLPGYHRLSRAVRPHGVRGEVHSDGRHTANPFLEFAPPGHFYSPLPDAESLERRKATIFDRELREVPGIENHAHEQLALVAEFASYYGELPFTDEKSPGRRYYFQNDWFSYGDAIVLYSMLRHARPRRVIEVGSGFSSAVMLDTRDLYLGDDLAFTFIEPDPRRLRSLFGPEDEARCSIITEDVQDVPLERFRQLGAGDILFIDSSHVAKVGSDVVHLLTHVLPSLHAGVLIHFHDIFWPFEYPEQWILEGRAWNESYVLKAFLQFNAAFRIRLFNAYLAIHHADDVGDMLPRWRRNPGGSLWIEKTS